MRKYKVGRSGVLALFPLQQNESDGPKRRSKDRIQHSFKNPEHVTPFCRVAQVLQISRRYSYSYGSTDKIDKFGTGWCSHFPPNPNYLFFPVTTLNTVKLLVPEPEGAHLP